MVQCKGIVSLAMPCSQMKINLRCEKLLLRVATKQESFNYQAQTILLLTVVLVVKVSTKTVEGQLNTFELDLSKQPWKS